MMLGYLRSRHSEFCRYSYLRSEKKTQLTTKHNSLPEVTKTEFEESLVDAFFHFVWHALIVLLIYPSIKPS